MDPGNDADGHHCCHCQGRFNPLEQDHWSHAWNIEGMLSLARSLEPPGNQVKDTVLHILYWDGMTREGGQVVCRFADAAKHFLAVKTLVRDRNPTGFA